MGFTKKIGSHTAIYGLSSIVGRFLNYLMVPLYTTTFSASSGDYGIVTNMYGYTALLLVILTYGMETTLMRYMNKEGVDRKNAYSTTLTTVTLTSVLFVGAVIACLGWIAPAMGYEATPQYVAVMAAVVALDAIQSIPFCYLRIQQRAVRFASLKLLFIFMNIALNVLYFMVFPAIYDDFKDVIGLFYDPTVGVGYVFYLNLVCSSMMMLFLWKDMAVVKWRIDKALLKSMLKYTWPLLLLGIAGILNQTADKILFRHVYTGADADVQLGIYGACVKIAMIMALITQAFRYAIEPLVFDKSNKDDNLKLQAEAMKFFVISTMIAFLAVMAGIDVLKYFIGKTYWEGLKVIPIVMVAEIMMGIYFNLSFWYKLTDRTIWGAIISFVGCAVMIAGNIIFVPQYGYMACAWSGVAGYGTAMVLSFVLGQHFAPVNYPVKRLSVYIALTVVFFFAEGMIDLDSNLWNTVLRSLVFCVFVAIVIVLEGAHRKFYRLPVVGRFFRVRG